MNIKALDQKAKEVAKNYLKLEAELLVLIMQIDKSKVFYQLGYSSLFAYVTQALKLSPATSYNFIKVARKSHEVPQLKEKVVAGKLSISKAQKMTSVLTKENKDHWIDLAQRKTHRELEREVAIASPKQAIKERAVFIHESKDLGEKIKIKSSVPRIALNLGISEKLMLQFRRVQDLESSRLKENLDLESTLEKLLEFYLEKKDPIKKAQRQKIKGKLQSVESKLESKKDEKLKKSEINSSREELNKSYSKKNRNQTGGKGVRRKSIPAKVVHQVQLRDRGQCTYKNQEGKRCSSHRYLEVHHIKPVSQGGDNKLENLTLLCSGHHKAWHLSSND